MKFDRNKCFYCEGWFYISAYGDNIVLKRTFDHVIPKSKGGTNDESNLVPCCHMCNGWKSAKFLEDFLHELKAFRNYSPFFTKEKVGRMVKNIEMLIKHTHHTAA